MMPPSFLRGIVTYCLVRMKDGTRTHFLNVDLDLVAKQDLAELVRAFEPGAHALHCMPTEEGYMANLELSTQPSEPEAAIHDFVGLIEKLAPEARGLWNAASKRDFSIGVEAGSLPSNFELALTPAVLKLAAEVGARITFVVYVHGPASVAVEPIG